MNLRDVRQLEAANSFKKLGILNCSPRFGKIKCTIEILKRDKPKRVLISYPRVDIKKVWEEDLKKWGYEGAEIHYSTFHGLKKEIIGDYDFLVVDEIHEASTGQLKSVEEFVLRGIPVLGLSGTITTKTEIEIGRHTGLTVVYSYPIEKAVEEGVLCDYKIYVHKVNLCKLPTGRYVNKFKKDISEKAKFDNLLYVYKKLKEQKKDWFFLEMKIIKLLQESYARTEFTKKLLKDHPNDRILVFCGLTDVADVLGIPVYHSKSKEKQLFADFCNGNGVNMMATIKMAQAGITILPIHMSVLNYSSGNPEDTTQKITRMFGVEYDNPDKKAIIHMVVINEPFELIRLNTSLAFFETNKIEYV